MRTYRMARPTAMMLPGVMMQMEIMQVDQASSPPP